MAKSKAEIPQEIYREAEESVRFRFAAKRGFKPDEPIDPAVLKRRADRLAPKLVAMHEMLAPLPAGKYKVTPPVWGCKNRFLGEFKDGDKPRVVELSAEAANELAGPNHPFKLERVE